MDDRAVSVHSARRLRPATRRGGHLAIEAVRARPTRLRSLSTLPLSSPADAVDELGRAAALGHVGTMVYGRSGDVTVDDPVHDDLFAAAADLGQPVFIHPQLPSPATRAALRLILRGTFDRHPQLQMVLGHWGEMLLFWLDRADSLARFAGIERPVSDYVRTNVVVTTSGMLNPALLRHALSVTTVDRLIFSTDHPFQRPTAEQITAFLGHFDSDEDRRLFSSENAVRFFGLAP